jgi:endoplasmic reticulum junction formation protein lunapark
VGVKSSGIGELSPLVVGPIVIYGVRKGITSVYAYRISRQQDHLTSLQKQRDGIITKLKEATKYDSTQQLLEKYAGTPAKPKKNPSNGKSSGDTKDKNAPKQGKPMIIPPPTANIPQNNRGGLATMPNTPQRSMPITPGPNPPFTAAAATPPWANQDPLQQASSSLEGSAEFAPNAFDGPAYYVQPGAEYGGGRWYDRLLDVLLGEDESHPKNRMALICSNCRLVNGQAPPGVKSLEDIGKWRCSACGTMNGESEVGRIVAEIQKEKSHASESQAIKEEDENDEPVVVGQDGDESDITQYSEGEKQQVEQPSKKKSVKSRKGRKFEDS